MTNDVINGCFEAFGAIAVLLSAKSVIKDRCYAGVSPWNLAFFFLWGIFNLFFYPSLHQYYSFLGSCALVLANTLYLLCLLCYPHRPAARSEYDNS